MCIWNIVFRIFRLFSVSLFLLGIGKNSFSQCSVEAFADPLTIVCGETIQLSATGNSGNLALDNDFNNGTPGTGWSATSAATYTNPCGNGPDGTVHLWMGDATPQPRTLTTVALDLSLGGQICFDLRFSIQGDAAPCEGPDEPDEGVFLQYSTDGGNTWNTINYFDPLGGNDPTLTTWNTYCFPIPTGAMTGTTLVRWFQDATSGAEYDHWGIDNVQIILNDPAYYYIWTHNQFQGAVPPVVSPTDDTTYTVVYTNGTTDACTASVNVVVNDPIINANAGTDQLICPGNCATLDATAEVILYPQQTVTFSNQEFQPVASAFGSTTEININVQGLNNPIGTATIQNVCIDGLTFFGQNLFPPSQVDIGALEINLLCPDGTSITLVPSGVTSGSPTTGYTNTCFVPSGGGAIGGGSAPYTGNYSPNQPFSGLNGCTSNGLWTISIANTAGLGIGTGFFDGWNITFDDPQVTAPANYTWSPTTGLSDPNSLNPDACPQQTTTYTLTVEDQNQCAQETSQVTVTVSPNCCTLDIDNIAFTNPTCGNGDGTITITASGGLAPISYSVDGGFTTQGNGNFTNIQAGIYYIELEDANGCFAYDTITLTNPSAPVIDNVATVAPTCGASDGSIVITASGGVAPLQYSVDNGATFQASNTFNGLPGGTYDIVVEDANGCRVSTQNGLTSGNAPTIDNVNPTDPSCGGQDGSINISASGGAQPLQYSIDNGTTFQATGDFYSLAAGTYDIVVEDANGCQVTDQVVFNAGVPPVIDNIAFTNPNCGVNDGTITITASGGNPPITYSIDGGFTNQANGNFTGVGAGIYYIELEDASGCFARDTVTLSNPSAPTIDNVSTIAPTCGNSDGSLTITASGGIAPLQYSIDNGATFQANGTFTGLSGGNYDIIVEDANGCQASTQNSVASGTGPTIDNLNPTSPSCGSQDGVLVISASGGAMPLQYSIDNGATFQVSGSFTGLASGSYNIVVEDANGCQATDQISLNNLNGPSIDNVAETTPTCGAQDGAIDITASGGSAPLQYSIDGGATFQASGSFAGLGAGTYDIIVEDNGGCQAADQVVFPGGTPPTIDNISITDPTCGNANGSIEVTVSGGAAPLQYSIDNGATFQASSSFSGLIGATYDIVVADNAGCQVIDQAALAISTAPTIDTLGSLPPTCGANDGIIGMLATGGAAPLQYSIDGGTTFQPVGAFQNLGTGTYDIVVEDANGCQATDQIVLNNLNGPTITNEASTNTTCGQDDGTITITASGGTAPLQYSIDGGTTFQAAGGFIDLPAGSYNVVVVDDIGCQALGQQIDIAASTQPVIDDITTTNSTCGSGDGSITITASGGAAPLQYSINAGNTFQSSGSFNNLTAGNYNVVIEDNTGCQVSGQAVVSNSNGPAIDDVSFTDPTCGNANGTVTVTASGGSTPLNFSIDNGNSFQPGGQFAGVGEGTYTIVVEDATGCRVMEQVTLTNTPSPTIDDITVVDATCGEDNAVLAIVATGGTAPLEYSIDGGINYSSALSYDSLASGTYTVYVRDANGCNDFEEVTIAASFPPKAEFSFVPIDATIFDTEITFNNQSSGAETYQWVFDDLGGSTDENPIFEFPDDEPGTYRVCLLAFNVDECVDTVCKLVRIEEGFTVFVPNAFTPNGNRLNDGFFPKTTGIKDYVLYIFDRWGGMIYSSNSEEHPWDGKTRDGGEYVKSGVYVWKFVVNDEKHGTHEYSGHVTLIK